MCLPGKCLALSIALLLLKLPSNQCPVNEMKDSFECEHVQRSDVTEMNFALSNSMAMEDLTVIQLWKCLLCEVLSAGNQVAVFQVGQKFNETLILNNRKRLIVRCHHLHNLVAYCLRARVLDVPNFCCFETSFKRCLRTSQFFQFPFFGSELEGTGFYFLFGKFRIDRIIFNLVPAFQMILKRSGTVTFWAFPLLSPFQISFTHVTDSIFTINLFTEKNSTPKIEILKLILFPY